MWQLRQLLPPAPTRCAPGRDTPCAVAAGQGHRIVKTAPRHWQASLKQQSLFIETYPNMDVIRTPHSGVFEIFIFILSRSQGQVGPRPRRPTQHGRKGAHPHTLPKVNVGATRPAHGRCKSDFELRPFYFKNGVTFFPIQRDQSRVAQVKNV